VFDPGPPLNDNPHQLTFSDAPTTPGMRRHCARAIAAFFGAMLVMNGGFRLAASATPRGAALAGLTILLGLAFLAPTARLAFRSARSIYRYRTDRCIHCAYPTRGLSGITCPECGRDPFL
jgi:hypothetical protein